jgi:hypothetical protein
MTKLQDGIEAYKKGKRDEARDYFRAALNENPKDEKAWGWLYQVSDYDDMRMACLNKILEINPANDKARQLLASMTPGKIVPPPPRKETVEPTLPGSQNTKANSKQVNNTLIGIGVILSLCFICLCAFWLYDPPSGPTDYKTMANIQCQLNVENRLKSPSSADFPSSLSTDIRDVGNNVFEIRSYVDSQNSFGAMIRTDYFCKIQYIGSEADDEADSRFWSLLQLDFAE